MDPKVPVQLGVRVRLFFNELSDHTPPNRGLVISSFPLIRKDLRAILL